MGDWTLAHKFVKQLEDAATAEMAVGTEIIDSNRFSQVGFDVGDEIGELEWEESLLAAGAVLAEELGEEELEVGVDESAAVRPGITAFIEHSGNVID